MPAFAASERVEAVQARLATLKGSDINPEWLPDIRANEANVQNIKSKLGELGIKVYTEPLDSPQGRKTRVRAGPFPSRDAAEKALEKMKRIGVSGVVAAK